MQEKYQAPSVFWPKSLCSGKSTHQMLGSAHNVQERKYTQWCSEQKVGKPPCTQCFLARCLVLFIVPEEHQKPRVMVGAGHKCTRRTKHRVVLCLAHKCQGSTKHRLMRRTAHSATTAPSTLCVLNSAHNVAGSCHRESSLVR